MAHTTYQCRSPSRTGEDEFVHRSTVVLGYLVVQQERADVKVRERIFFLPHSLRRPELRGVSLHNENRDRYRVLASHRREKRHGLGHCFLAIARSWFQGRCICHHAKSDIR